MASLSEVYQGGVGSVVDPRQRLFGMGLFVVGAAMVVSAIPVATTDLGASLGLDVYEARELAGVLAGLGLPAVFVGIFAVLPASDLTRATAAIGASLAGLGVVLFVYAYPHQWLSNSPELAIGTTVVYALGTLVTFWCVFVGVATFKTRNDPGGAARLEITDEGIVRVVSTDSVLPSFGSVGLFGSEPTGTVPTQTNQTDEHEGTETAFEPSGDRDEDKNKEGDVVSEPTMKAPVQQSEPEPTGDGAGAVVDSTGVNDDIVQATRTRGNPDRYCGNCTHFEYVRADGQITPYCGLTDTLMEDMDACEDWTPNETDRPSPFD
jgi:hypothetical protein